MTLCGICHRPIEQQDGRWRHRLPRPVAGASQHLYGLALGSFMLETSGHDAQPDTDVPAIWRDPYRHLSSGELREAYREEEPHDKLYGVDRAARDAYIEGERDAGDRY